ncbi:hypothetical protein DHL47_08740 [Streptococcus panodentis]|uniref:Uncharacterized protein n=1 Tax=Streptococcus panodentis TaxID=1581472 RepID=A0ABS5AXU3_9STRE|nr:hypothetical protein [Streptococcus panodentis]
MLSLFALSGRHTSRRLRPVTAKGGGTAIMGVLYSIFPKIHPSVGEGTAIMGVCLSLFAALGQ